VTSWEELELSGKLHHKYHFQTYTLAVELAAEVGILSIFLGYAVKKLVRLPTDSHIADETMWSP
jgi:hypothetical protein